MTPDQLKQYRKQHRLTQQGLADKLHVSKRAVVAWETTQNPIPAWVEKLITEDQLQVNPTVSYEVFKKSEAIAAAQGLTMDQWIAKIMEDAVNYGIKPPPSD